MKRAGIIHGVLIWKFYPMSSNIFLNKMKRGYLLMKKILASVTLMALVLSMAACGGSGDTASTDTAKAESIVSEATSKAGEVESKAESKADEIESKAESKADELESDASAADASEATSDASAADTSADASEAASK